MTRGARAVRLPRWVDPASVHRLLSGRGPATFWLDAGADAREGWSYVGAGEPERDPERVRAVPLAGQGDDTWPAGAFRGGWVGWLGYEDAARRAGAPVAESSPADGAAWIRAREWVAFDHATRSAWAVGAPDRAGDLAAEVCRPPAETRLSDPEIGAVAAAVARHSPAEYAALIDSCRAAIREGDAYQLCLTTRFSVPGRRDPIATYERLRAAHPAHHGGLIRIGGRALASASPERFLEVAAGTVRTSPIKGTRPRGADAARDAALAEELRTDVKERAENVMIVDLMRNDLSRVCVAGSVGVDALLQVESYPAVHQLVSTVSGVLTGGVSAGDLWDAAFPAGSMTGAPKLSAMQILHRLEGSARGVFAGCFGWVGENGGMDLAMVIRSVFIDADGAYVGAGGGITWRSRPAAEVAEVALKATGPLAAVGARLPAEWAQVGVG